MIVKTFTTIRFYCPYLLASFEHKKCFKIHTKPSPRLFFKADCLPAQGIRSQKGRRRTGRIQEMLIYSWMPPDCDSADILPTTNSNSFFTLKKYFRFILLDPERRPLFVDGSFIE
jgi:hypothetical protein